MIATFLVAGIFFLIICPVLLRIPFPKKNWIRFAFSIYNNFIVDHKAI